MGEGGGGVETNWVKSICSLALFSRRPQPNAWLYTAGHFFVGQRESWYLNGPELTLRRRKRCFFSSRCLLAYTCPVRGRARDTRIQLLCCGLFT